MANSENKISANATLLSEKKINANVSPLNNIAKYKEYEQVRQQNELTRISNEQVRQQNEKTRTSEFTAISDEIINLREVSQEIVEKFGNLDINVTQTENGAMIEFTDKEGEKKDIEILNGTEGPEGPAGPEGKSYNLTQDDKNEIAQIVLRDFPTAEGSEF